MRGIHFSRHRTACAREQGGAGRCIALDELHGTRINHAQTAQQRIRTVVASRGFAAVEHIGRKQRLRRSNRQGRDLLGDLAHRHLAGIWHERGHGKCRSARAQQHDAKGSQQAARVTLRHAQDGIEAFSSLRTSACYKRRKTQNYIPNYEANNSSL